MATPTLAQFLGEISRILREKNAAKLQDYLVIEPPYGEIYNVMINELRSAFQKDKEDDLEGICSQSLPEASEGMDGSSWTAFIKFIVQYFTFIRDVNIENLLDTYNLLSELVQKANSALSHPSMGIVILPTVIAYSKVLARVAIGLDKHPELIAHIPRPATDDETAETLPERAANIVRHAFVSCLNDRTPAAGPRPAGKKIAIYTLANICLKILFACQKSHNAEQIFANIYNLSPPLPSYPASERVKYLYYLGRFQFNNSHFGRASAALDHAYRSCRAEDVPQRRSLLVHLIASNIILGRFPSPTLYSRPEAIGFEAAFGPITQAITRGDLATFHLLTELPTDGSTPNETVRFLLRHRVLLQINSRCEVLTWRCLIRRIFILSGDPGDAASKRAPTLDLKNVLAGARMLYFFEHAPPGMPFDINRTAKLPRYVDPDLEGAPSDDYDSGSEFDGEYSFREAAETPLIPDMPQVEGILASLIQQGLVNGYLSHARRMLAIKGAKSKGGNAVAAGFPAAFEVLWEESDMEVPGWKKDGGAFVGMPGPGTTLNLSGARPVGAG